jgi:hypothetical protein
MCYSTIMLATYSLDGGPNDRPHSMQMHSEDAWDHAINFTPSETSANSLCFSACHQHYKFIVRYVLSCNSMKCWYVSYICRWS